MKDGHERSVGHHVNPAIGSARPLSKGTRPPCGIGKTVRTRRTEKSQGGAALPTGVRGGLQHHSCHGEGVVPIFIDRGAPAKSAFLKLATIAMRAGGSGGTGFEPIAPPSKHNKERREDSTPQAGLMPAALRFKNTPNAVPWGRPLML
jgi:hypothetical protein